jgi:hypothetical protein
MVKKYATATRNFNPVLMGWIKKKEAGHSTSLPEN